MKISSKIYRLLFGHRNSRCRHDWYILPPPRSIKEVSKITGIKENVVQEVLSRWNPSDIQWDTEVRLSVIQSHHPQEICLKCGKYNDNTRQLILGLASEQAKEDDRMKLAQRLWNKQHQ